MPINYKQQRAILEQKEKASRDASKLIAQWAALDHDEEFVPQYSSRFEVPPPDPKDTSKYNKHKIVDIETFVTHPHYLNLKPYPWQILALKLYYMGTEGNTHLTINEAKKEEEDGCSKCVWKYIVDDEQKMIQDQEEEAVVQPLLSPLNSRCLTCERCPLKVRQKRLEYEIQEASDPDIESNLIEIQNTPVQDLFQSEADLIEELPDELVKMQIKNKLKNKFQDLVLIIGRRGSKSFMTVAIAAYELYRLLSIAHPQKNYKLPDHQEIHIINVARNEEQAKDAIFTPLKNSIVSSPFFQRFIGLDNALEMKFKTEFDLKENERRTSKGLTLLDGTIVLKCGSSSAAGMVGKTCWAVIMDELAAMAGDNPNSGLDKKLYSDLKPSIATFGKDGKIICLSNPKGPFGQLFTLYNTRMEDRTTLILKIPTWQINANVDRSWLAEQQRQDPVEYNMQFGAEFGSNSEHPYFSAEDVDYVFDNSTELSRKESRDPVVDYYCHIDPANRSDYYAIAVVHSEFTGDYDILGQPIKRFIVDHIHFWSPLQLRQPVPLPEVEKYIFDLHERFKFKQISCDQWGSMDAIPKWQTMGLPIVLRQFNKEYKDKIYLNILEVVRDHRISFYKMSGGRAKNREGNMELINEIPEARNQFTFLQKKWKGNRAIIEALTGYKDDITDAVAAAVYECGINAYVAKTLPQARVAYTGKGIR